jgi:hypothetical protein
MTADWDRLAPISPDAFGSESERKAFPGHEFGRLWNVGDCCVFDTGNHLAQSAFLVLGNITAFAKKAAVINERDWKYRQMRHTAKSK